MTILEMTKNPQPQTQVEEAVQKAKISQAKLNAIVTLVDPNSQLEQLKGKERGLLYGVPIALKDNVTTKGIKTTASSHILDNYIPVFNAHIVDKLAEAGAIVIAKTSMDELAMGGTNLSAATGPVHNPYDFECMAGGSSGGSAALVAAGVVPMAIGSDTGDSVRKPASYCGIVGMKPTYGRISRYGIIPYSSSLDHVGFFTRSVEDAAVTLEVLAGRDDRDMTSSYREVPHYLQEMSSDIRGKKIAVIKNVVDAITHDETKKLFQNLLKSLAEKGAIITEVVLDEKLMKAALPTYYLIANCEATANHSNLDAIRFGVQQLAESAEEIMIRSRTQGFSALIRKRFVIGSYGLMEENQDKLFRQAQRVRRLIVEEVKRSLMDADVMIAPASSSGAPKLKDTSRDQLKDSYLIAENHMVLGNFTGYPSCTVPMGLVEGMPLGVNLTAKAFDEVNLLGLCLAVEQITGLKDVAQEVKE